MPRMTLVEARAKAHEFARKFSEWVENESGVDFWIESDGEEQLEEMLTEFIIKLE